MGDQATSLRRDLDAQRARSGAYPCVIDWGQGLWSRDENGFATALVLRRARRLGIHLNGLDVSLDFLESCAAQPPGAYAFWPPATRPAWAVGIPPDADDTAVITLELYAHGRRSRDQAASVVADVLVPAALGQPLRPGPPWWRAGAFPTWLRAGGADRHDVLDCAVNANVLALMAVLDARDQPGFAASVDLVRAAVQWVAEAGPDSVAMRADSIAPYYATPAAVAHILDEAVWCGVQELAEARDLLAALVAGAAGGAADPGALWRNAYDGPTWRCDALLRLAQACAATT